MASPRLSVRISPTLLNRLQSHVDCQGLTVSEGVLAAIASYVGDNERLPLVERVSRLEKKMALIERKV